MRRAPASLRRLQRRFSEALRAGGPLDWVATGGASAAERIAVYREGVAERLLQSLRAEYPALRRWLGEELFDLFARGYLEAHPPRSYTLGDLGDRFPDHLAATRPAGADPQLDLPVELARAERLRVEVARLPGVEGDDPAWFDAENVLARARLAPNVRWLETSFPLASLLNADPGAPAVPPRPEPSLLVVSRREHRVVFADATKWQARFLARVRRGGRLGRTSREEAPLLPLFLDRARLLGWLTPARSVDSAGVTPRISS